MQHRFCHLTTEDAGEWAHSHFWQDVVTTLNGLCQLPVGFVGWWMFFSGVQFVLIINMVESLVVTIRQKWALLYATLLTSCCCCCWTLPVLAVPPLFLKHTQLFCSHFGLTSFLLISFHPCKIKENKKNMDCLMPPDSLLTLAKTRPSLHVSGLISGSRAKAVM